MALAQATKKVSTAKTTRAKTSSATSPGTKTRTKTSSTITARGPITASRPATSRHTTAPTPPKFDVPSLQDLLEAGAHFGHKVSRWNPKMEQYIFDTRNNMHIIDLTQTLGLLEEAVKFLFERAQKGNILLVGTKGQAATIIKNSGVDHGAFYISRRWPGGLLTNFKVVRKSVKRLMEIEENLASGKGYETKRERLVMERDRDRLVRLYEGIRFMESSPSAIVVIDSRVEKNAIKEARRMKVPVVALLDTNCDPSLVDYPIPANDDAIRSIELFVDVLVQGFSNTDTSSKLIQRRNDYLSQLDETQKRTLAEEERIRKERELEVQRLKAMKEGKSITGLGDTGKVVRIIQKKEVPEEKPVEKPKRVTRKPVTKKKTTRKTAARKATVSKAAVRKTTKKVTAKKASSGKASARKTAIKKTATKKTAAKKTAVKKKSRKKTTTKKSTTKK